MEERKILVANSKTQQRTELTSAATTLGELKAELREAGIDYDGLTFTEGFTKTQLLRDDSLLPTNIMHRGQVTNDLVILLTNTTKNIASGMEDRSRIAAYELINNPDMEGIKEDIKEEFGRNYTHVPTEDLWDFLDRVLEDEDEIDDEENEEEEEFNTEEVIAGVNDVLKNTLSYLSKAQEALNVAQAGINGCITQLTELAPKTYKIGGTEISEDEINSMMAGV